MSVPAIRIEHLIFAWPGQTTPCLDLPSLAIAAGERVFMHGPSGSGKSTLLNVIAGVTTPQAGDLALLGTAMGQLSRRARDRFRADHIGFVFQQFNLLPWLSALDNVLLACAFSPRRRQRCADGPPAAATQLLRQLDLDPALWQSPAHRLSVGQQQRVAAARALIGRPELIIADEPTSALDADRQQRFIDLLLAESAAAGAALLFVSHDQRLAAHFDRSVALGEINRATGGEA